jgi:type III restriction enzyme
MKLKFKNQQYQADATHAVVRVFSGQTKGYRKETVGRTKLFVEEVFSNKKIELAKEDVLKNVQEIQKEQGIPVVKALQGLNFTVEMETGTGKTYVYTKTMFELHKQYGWNKFIVMVPSVAIREGVHKSLEITQEHFQEIYGKKIRFFIYNTKNKSNLINIKSFASTANIEVIIMNYQAFATRSKEARKIYQKLDVLQSEKPIDIIKRVHPVLIIDEPQRFGDRAESMLHEFDPLFILRYSATPKKDYNKIYRLDAIDAYNQKLVKKISVKGIEVIGNTGTNSYLFLERINISANSYPTAHIEMEIKQQSGVKKTIRKIEQGDDLFALSNELPEYKGFVVKEINGYTNKVYFTNGVEIDVGQAQGDMDEDHVRRIQIRETIKSHLAKERLMYQKGIKVLSLFFIDEVAKYRIYDDNGNPLKGEYARIFEEEYLRAVSDRELFDGEYSKYLDKFKVEQIHKGYFSVDKKGRFIDSKEKRGEGGSDDESAYDLIMKNKEKLLSFSEPTRFIFSHSALREGWDNPNVFQICTLKHSNSVISKRQEIGRGLRICVNKNGERMDFPVLEQEFFDINTLTVIASESYENFARELQKEILESLSERPVKLTPEVLKGRVLKNKEGKSFVFDETTAMDLIFQLKMKGYLDEQYQITDTLIEDIEQEKFEVPEKLKDFKKEVAQIMVKIHTTANFEAASNDNENNVDEPVLKPNGNFAKKEFQELWNRIKVKTVYEVDFDGNELIRKCVEAINQNLQVKKVKVSITVGTQQEELSEESLKTGQSMTRLDRQVEKTESILGSVKYDLVAEITKGANITRKTTVEILKKISPGKFHQFKVNPEDFILQVTSIINQQKAATLIDNITYSKTDQAYTDEVFTINNFKGSLKENILQVKKHIYDYVKTDSKVERKFAAELETGEVLVYAKLPGGFKIPTPVGSYNPDWAIVFDKEDVKYIYFIAETKGSMNTLQLKGAEKLKIGYARKHFASLNHSDIKYDVISSYDELLEKVM